MFKEKIVFRGSFMGEKVRPKLTCTIFKIIPGSQVEAKLDSFNGKPVI